MTEFLESLSKLEFDKVLARLASFAATELGHNKIRQLRPFFSPDEIRESLRCVSEMKHILETDIPPPFDAITDCRQYIHRATIADSIITAPELRRIANLLVAARQLRIYFTGRKGVAASLCLLTDQIRVDKVLEFNILQAISETGEVYDTASKDLSRIRAKILGLQELLKGRLASILRGLVELDWAQDEIITTRDGRMVVPVKAEHKHHVPGFIHSSSVSGQTVFIEPAETLDLNNEIRSLLFDEQREVTRILGELTRQVRVQSDDLTKLIQVIESIDVVFAKAKYSIHIEANEPRMTEESTLELFDARHPLLLEQLGKGRTVPLDISLGKEYNTIVISGPNAGGKSVAMKTVGLAAAMVQAGMHAPVSADSRIPFLAKVFVDIGDEQSIENNLSTFTSHLGKLKMISEEADRQSLVLVDEICAGTDPAEAGALAAAILEKVTKVKALTIVTTHNGYLKAFAAESDRIENASMEFDQVSLTPSYKLRTGIPGSSYALEIANRLGLSKELLSSAKQYLGKEGERLNELMAELELVRKGIEQERAQMAQDRQLAQTLRAEYEMRLSKITGEVSLLKRRAVEEARSILQRANALIEETIGQMREHNVTHAKALQARKTLNEFQSLLDSSDEATDHPDSVDITFTIGDTVKLKNGNEVGEVLDILDRNNLIIFSGNSKIKVNKDSIVHAKSPSPNRGSRVSAASLDRKERRLDVRGMYGEEAVGAVDKFLDDAIIGGLTQVEIIHGKGAGALRKRIHDLLKAHHQVRAFRLGDWSEGGVGITIVNLK